MTSEEFLAFYPQFGSAIPPAVLSAFVDSANLRFEDFFEDAPEARRLYVAHKLTLYAKTMPASAASGSSSSYSSLASAGGGSVITSKKVDGVAVTYASGKESSDSAFADLSETTYGLQLLSLIRLYSFTHYVP